MAACASIALDRRKEGETALEILDMAAEASGVRGMDAEFDDAFDPGEPMHSLVVEAFGDGRSAYIDPEADDDEDGWDAFYDGPYAQFKKRYDLC